MLRKLLISILKTTLISKQNVDIDIVLFENIVIVTGQLAAVTDLVLTSPAQKFANLHSRSKGEKSLSR